MNNPMAFQFSTVADARAFGEIYEDVCEVQADAVDEVMLDARRCEGWRVR